MGNSQAQEEETVSVASIENYLACKENNTSPNLNSSSIIRIDRCFNKFLRQIYTSFEQEKTKLINHNSSQIEKLTQQNQQLKAEVIKLQNIINQKDHELKRKESLEKEYNSKIMLLETQAEEKSMIIRQLQTELHVFDQENKAVLLTGDQERKIQDIKNLLLDIKDNLTTEFILDTFNSNDRNMEMNYYSFILFNTFQHVLSNEDKFTTVGNCWNNFVTACNQKYFKYLNNINEFKDKYIEIVEKAFEMKELASKNKIPPFKLIWLENSSNFDQTKQQILHTEYITTMTNNETKKKGTREYITLTPVFCVGTENVVYEKAYVVLRVYQ
ncbi:hypothetical protein ABK040_015997 [Willaertia magna]